MKTLQLKEAKSAFSAIVEAAEHGEPTIVAKHGYEDDWARTLAVFRACLPRRRLTFRPSDRVDSQS